MKIPIKQTENTRSAAVFMISLALAMRQISMSIVSPFISTYCKTLSGYTTLLAGVTLGIFGLMQAVFQTPFGMLSDKYGNKKILLSGLMITVLGLLLAWKVTTIQLLILARALQGSGAIIGVGYSWAAGIVSEDRRTKSMGLVSLMITSAVAVAFILGPVLRRFMTVDRIFLVCALVICITVLYILFFVPDTRGRKPVQKTDTATFKTLLSNKKFTRLCAAAFLNNFMMMSIFFAVPVYLAALVKETELWLVFLLPIICAICAMSITIRLTDKGYGDTVLIVAFLISTLSMVCLQGGVSLLLIILGTTFFFGGYASLAAVLAAKINETAADEYRGTANGLFNALQYLGNFAGPVVTGFLWKFSNRVAFLPVFFAGTAGILLTAINWVENHKIGK